MSVPPEPPRPVPRPSPAQRRNPASKGVMPAGARWGWNEGFILSQTLLAAALFLPGISPVRTAIRIGSYMVGLWAWVAVSRRGGSGPGVESFPARPWLIVCVAWLTLSLAHPNIYSAVTAVGQVMLYVTILSPAFWAGGAVGSPKQMGRIMAVLFLCNALSAALGFAQVRYPGRFDPPVIPAMSNQFGGEDMMYQAIDGQIIMRPCGLTDTPGGAAPAGAATALIGLCWALRPIAWWKRLASAGLAFVGVAVIYYTQVRSVLIMLGICLTVLTALLAYQGNVRGALSLVCGGVVAVVGSLFWVTRSLGNQVWDRFGVIVSGDVGTFLHSGRGKYVEEALGRQVWDNPLGYGLGWFGMVYTAFRDPLRPTPVWVEVMIPAWVMDGGVPLLVGYFGALVAAVLDSFRIASTSRDPELRFWAAVVVSLNLSIVANCFSFVTFLSPIGPQFWLLSAALHAADAQSRLQNRRASPRGAAVH